MVSAPDNTSVIIVDDDYDSLEVLSEYLSIKNLNVIAKAKNGAEAVIIYEKLQPDVVLLDVIMPEYDGFYALQKIKGINPNAKVIFVTAATAGVTQKRLFESNVEAIIFKPFEMDYLLETIDMVKQGKKRIPNTVRALNKTD
ncbi:MAG: response regulator [Crenarchaeota archaeon]|nr:MAG: response regulator [Thermoproteota archaeon]RDJ32946.1 MAG: response regulator [Thermoproteota archaeon]RDJ35973.1 MAG: response regulator [Thermoproteota archaeon]RDJ38218.1 MAG: response regulator [Thermoproteota archaeon]